MKTAVLYTVLSLVGLIGYAVGVGLLPAQVPIHFGAAMTADVLGSPWVFLALPGAAALISGGIWASLVQKKHRAVTVGLLSALGIALSTVGWAFFSLAASGAGIGEKAPFPFTVVIGLPLSLLVVWLGNCLSHAKQGAILGVRTRAALSSEEVWRKANRAGGGLFLAAGLLSAVLVTVFGCVPALSGVWYLAAAAAVALVGGATALSFLCAVLAAKGLRGSD